METRLSSRHLWQHSENGSVPGIDGAVDRDVFNGGLAVADLGDALWVLCG